MDILYFLVLQRSLIFGIFVFFAKLFVNEKLEGKTAIFLEEKKKLFYEKIVIKKICWDKKITNKNEIFLHFLMLSNFYQIISLLNFFLSAIF
jgi:hypothetical protein